MLFTFVSTSVIDVSNSEIFVDIVLLTLVSNSDIDVSNSVNLGVIVFVTSASKFASFPSIVDSKSSSDYVTLAL